MPFKLKLWSQLANAWLTDAASCDRGDTQVEVAAAPMWGCVRVTNPRDSEGAETE